MLTGLDDKLNLAARRRGTVTLRRLAQDGRLVLRRSELEIAPGEETPSFWVDVVHPVNPSTRGGFEITEESYTQLLTMGVPVTKPDRSPRAPEDSGVTEECPAFRKM
jgi:hypothetical protein